MNTQLAAFITEADEIDQEVFAYRWQEKVAEYLTGVGEHEACERFEAVTQENVFDAIAKQQGILLALGKRSDTNPPARIHSAMPSKGPVRIPEKITLRWLTEHVPLKFWSFLAVSYVVIFGAGLKLGEYKFFTAIWEKLFGT